VYAKGSFTVRVEETPYEPDDDIDIVFFGICSPRRKEFVERMHGYADMWAGLGYRKPVNMHMYCISEWNKALLDADRDHKVMSAKVVVNIHNLETSSLEVHRINYLLSMGKCVVSESSSFDPELDKEYADAIDLLPTFELIAFQALRVIDDPTYRYVYK
jgi:hypothetical protein